MAAVVHLADTDTANVVVVVDRTDQNLCGLLRIAFGSREYSPGSSRTTEPCSRAHRPGILRPHTGLCGSKDKRAVQLLVVRIQFHQKLQNLIDDFIRAGLLDGLPC